MNAAPSEGDQYDQNVFSFQRAAFYFQLPKQQGKRSQNQIAENFLECACLTQCPAIADKQLLIKARSIFVIGVVAAIGVSCANVGSVVQSPAAQRDYQRLTGTWQLTRGVVNGKSVPANVARDTILITDRNTFRFPKQSGIGTHPAGQFTVNPNTRPKQVDTTAEGGPNAGQLTRGIYEIIDPTHKRACWGPPGGPRPTEFTSTPGSHRILQYWKKIGPAPSQ